MDDGRTVVRPEVEDGARAAAFVAFAAGVPTDLPRRLPWVVIVQAFAEGWDARRAYRPPAPAPAVTLDFDLARRLLDALNEGLTPRGHLAQKVTHEGLGYCSHAQESERCTARRRLIAALAAALGGAV